MAFTDKIKRVKDFIQPEEAKFQKLTADEVELKSFQERERLDNVKKELARFRQKDSAEFLGGKYLEKQPSLLKDDKKHSLFHSPDIFKEKKGKRKGGNCILNQKTTVGFF